ncbi:uncharacterized protein N7469_005894 [Penicillium citrinum]|uniref:TOM complex component Tom7 n=2 Tax=Penicillium TaxID=5073 RepID=A0A9W9TLW7_PENCI|nr:uncharacterized protein N7469_005894 [Penicillium citrinum]KAJ5231306.1 hypothetical protein N7469_005894 [Penicillium citrinum]KAJ5578840.1 hypothetical protein N7450_007707 [Penicillium hetheringtonii]
MVQFSEETKERVSKVIDISRVAIHYGYLPLIIYLGMFETCSRIHSPLWRLYPFVALSDSIIPGYSYSEPKPSLFKLFSPLA